MDQGFCLQVWQEMMKSDPQPLRWLGAPARDDLY